MDKVKVLKADITKLDIDAIVNAANSSLLGGGGVDGAIHKAGGPEILEACKAIRKQQGECHTGEAVITTAGQLLAKYVIHTVGPVWTGHDHEVKDKMLENCYTNSLKLAVENGIQRIAFPNISTGVYHFPKDRAAGIALNTVQKFLKENKSIEEVVFVCFDDENFHIYQDKLTPKPKEKLIKIAVFPGSFDPITSGHVDLVKRAVPFFDEIVVAIGVNSQKKYLFSLEKRKEWLEKVFEKEEKVKVDTFEGLTAHFCQKIGAQYLLRGLRNSSDFDYEKTISQLNNIVGDGLETIFLISKPEFSHISSTIVREIIKGKGDARSFLPKEVIINLEE